MMPHDDPPFDAVDRGLDAMFAAGEQAPPPFTVDVLRRIQQDRWRRERRLDRIFYAGLCASGVLVIVGLRLAFGTLAGVVATGHDTIFNGQVLSSVENISGDAAMKLALAGLVVTVLASWRRLYS
jgi:hypothetical protein